MARPVAVSLIRHRRASWPERAMWRVAARRRALVTLLGRDRTGLTLVAADLSSLARRPTE